MAAAMGADEYGFGSVAMIATGCVMARICHTNNCPVGVASQVLVLLICHNLLRVSCAFCYSFFLQYVFREKNCVLDFLEFLVILLISFYTLLRR